MQQKHRIVIAPASLRDRAPPALKLNYYLYYEAGRRNLIIGYYSRHDHQHTAFFRSSLPGSLPLRLGSNFLFVRQKESLAKKIPQVCGTRLGCSSTRLSVANRKKKLAALKQFFSGYIPALMIEIFQDHFFTWFHSDVGGPVCAA
jgi:hypothetical protein